MLLKHNECYNNPLKKVRKTFYGVLSIRTLKLLKPFNKSLKTLKLYKYSTNRNMSVIITRKKSHKTVNG